MGAMWICISCIRHWNDDLIVFVKIADATVMLSSHPHEENQAEVLKRLGEFRRSGPSMALNPKGTVCYPMVRLGSVEWREMLIELCPQTFADSPLDLPNLVEFHA